MAKIDDLLGAFRRRYLDHMLDDLAFWRPSQRTLHKKFSRAVWRRAARGIRMFDTETP